MLELATEPPTGYGLEDRTPADGTVCSDRRHATEPLAGPFRHV